MKKLFLFLSISFSLQAQSDSLKVTFSEEKVEKFEKTTLIDEYEKAFGGNRMVKSGLRVRNVPNYFGNRGSLMPQLEQKIGKSFSVIASPDYKILKVWETTFGLETRYYLNQDPKFPNINGEFFSFFGKITNAKDYEYVSGYFRQNYHNDYMPKDRMIFKERLAIGTKYGIQLGNYLQWAVSAGIKFGTKTAVNSENYLILNPSQILNPFIAINSEFGLGFLFPKPKFQRVEKCEIVNCNIRKVSLLKLSSTNTFYIDRFTKRVQGKIAYERKLGLTPFSINTSLAANYKSFENFAISSIKDTLVYENVVFQSSTWSGRPKVDTYDIQYENSVVKNARINLTAAAQLRYYIMQHKKLKNGLENNNLNGLYMVAECTKNQETIILKRQKEANLKGITNIMNYGLGAGLQTQSSKNTYVDLSIVYGMLVEDSSFLNDSRADFKTGTVWVTVDFGLAR
jgi:hypothetical protein